MSELKRIKIQHIYICPYCNYHSRYAFPLEKYQGGSSGYRTFKCPNCSEEMEE